MTLNQILKEQRLLLASMGYPGGKFGEEAAKGHLLAAIHECTEAMNELNWKPWKRVKKKVSHEKLATELMDIIQFVANAAIVMDIDAKTLESALKTKLVENFDRIKRGEVTSG